MKLPSNLFFLNDEARKLHEKMFRKETFKVIDGGKEKKIPSKRKKKNAIEVVIPKKDDDDGGPNIA